MIVSYKEKHRIETLFQFNYAKPLNCFIHKLYTSMSLCGKLFFYSLSQMGMCSKCTFPLKNIFVLSSNDLV